MFLTCFYNEKISTARIFILKRKRKNNGNTYPWIYITLSFYILQFSLIGTKVHKECLKHLIRNYCSRTLTNTLWPRETTWSEKFSKRENKRRNIFFSFPIKIESEFNYTDITKWLEIVYSTVNNRFLVFH